MHANYYNQLVTFKELFNYVNDLHFLVYRVSEKKSDALSNSNKPRISFRFIPMSLYCCLVSDFVLFLTNLAWLEL